MIQRHNSMDLSYKVSGQVFKSEGADLLSFTNG